MGSSTSAGCRPFHGPSAGEGEGGGREGELSGGRPRVNEEGADVTQSQGREQDRGGQAPGREVCLA